MDPVSERLSVERVAGELQTAMREHVVDPNNLSVTEEFLARALGALYATRPERFRGGMMKEIEGAPGSRGAAAPPLHG